MFKRLMELIAPFQVIAAELRIIRELYELELAARDKPLIRITESGRDDTEVIWGEQPEKSKLRMILDGDERPETED